MIFSAVGGILVAALVADLAGRMKQSKSSHSVPDIPKPKDDVETKFGEKVEELKETKKPEIELKPQQPPPKKKQSSWLIFSPLANLEKIHSIPDPKKKQDPDLSVLNGIRVMSLLWVIVGHTYFLLLSAMDNLGTMLDLIGKYSFQFINAGMFAVDSFFFLSGFLAYWSLAKRFRSKHFRLWQLPMVYVHRYLRITPPHLAIILIATGLWPYIGDGPFYYQFSDYYCQRNWWVNMLYISNFYDITYQCVGWVWYLMIDMQLFLLMPFVVLSFVKAPKLGWVICILGIAAQIANGIWITIVYRIPMVGYRPPNYEENFENCGDDCVPMEYAKQYEYYYVKPYTRMGPYIIGVIAAHILMVHRKQVDKVMSSLWLNILGWLLSFGVVYAIIYGPYDYYAGNYLNPLWVEALFNAFTRMVWAIPLAWIVLSCSTGHAGIIGDIMAWNGFAIPARLSYAAYLLHPLVQAYFGQTL